MHDLLRLARSLRCDPADHSQAFRHRLGVGLAIAALILIFTAAAAVFVMDLVYPFVDPRISLEAR